MDENMERVLEITRPANIHICDGQLQIEQNENEVIIPIEDLSIIIAQGSDIRLSTMDISILAEHNVLFLTIGKNYLPSSMTLTFNNNSRQSITMEKQLLMTKRKINYVWNQIIQAKIRNQASVLAILGKSGSNEVNSYASKVIKGDKNNVEAIAANKYFKSYYPGLNRRCECPMNSCLNYGYSIIRSSIARSLASHGFLLSKGIYHHNSLNAFNLVDDMIEPFRAFVDLVAISVVSSNVSLTKEQRRKLMEILFMDCRIDNQITSIQNAIEIYVSSFKSYVFEESEEILCPEILPIKVRSVIEE